MHDVEVFRVRLGLIQAFLRKNQYDGILLSRVDNFAMATGGKQNYVNIAGEEGGCSLFVDADANACYVGNNIEKSRVITEELAGITDEIREFLWFEDSDGEAAKRHFGGNIVSDTGAAGPNVNADLAYLRSLLTEAELEKYRRLGALGAEAMTATIQAIEADQAEADIAATLTAEAAKRRCLLPVCLIAADDRIASYRHPLPTYGDLLGGGSQEHKVRNYVMVVGCFQREGLIVSMTRFKRVGELPASISDAFERICGVDAMMQEATVPGKTLGDVFAACQAAYKDLGFPENEWHNHHQGGPTGYSARTAKGAPGSTFPIADPAWPELLREHAGMDASLGQAYAWNPSAVGVKSEDTFILLPDGTKEIVTGTPELPAVDVSKVLGRRLDIPKSGIAGP